MKKIPSPKELFAPLWTSLRLRIVCGAGSVIIALLLLLLYNNLYAIRVVRNQVSEANRQALSWYVRQLDASLSDVEKYLVGLQSSNANLRSIGNPRDDVEFYTAQALLRKDLETALPSYRSIDGVFVSNPGRETYLDVADYNVSVAEREAVQRLVDSLLPGMDQPQTGKWLPVSLEGEHYLIRLLRVGPTYYGAWLNLANTVPALMDGRLQGMEFLFFRLPDGTPLASGLPQLEERAPRGGSSHYTMVDGDRRYMLLSQNLSGSEISLAALIGDNSILEGLDSLAGLIASLFLILLVLLPLFGWIIRRWMLRPLDDLSGAMLELAGGNLNVRLSERNTLRELRSVNETFDAMTREIKKLKIDVYEERLHSQQTQLQYLQLQVNPHFTINCLNIIHSLSALRRYDLIRQMTEYLGKHLRYTLGGSALTSLKQEAEHIGNYLELQQLRFPGSLECSVEIDPQVLDAAVPPLCIQTFVENTVKYQVVAGEVTAISIRAQRVFRQSSNCVRICVEDTGEGYPPEILEMLRSGTDVVDRRGEHIGIRNLVQRLNLLYGGKEEVRLYNGSGACVEMIFPYQTYGGDRQ